MFFDCDCILFSGLMARVSPPSGVLTPQPEPSSQRSTGLHGYFKLAPKKTNPSNEPVTVPEAVFSNGVEGEVPRPPPIDVAEAYVRVSMLRKVRTKYNADKRKNAKPNSERGI